MEFSIWTRWRIKRAVWKEMFWMWLSNKMPRKLVYYCAIRIAVHATTGRWSGVEVPAVTVVDALWRWEGSGMDCKPEDCLACPLAEDGADGLTVN